MQVLEEGGGGYGRGTYVQGCGITTNCESGAKPMFMPATVRINSWLSGRCGFPEGFQHAVQGHLTVKKTTRTQDPTVDLCRGS